MPTVGAQRCERIDELASPGFLGALLGEVREVKREPLSTVGYAGARHERLTVTLATGEVRSLVLKRSELAADWTAIRTADTRGRETALLEEAALSPVWEAFVSPYLAWSREEGVGAVLMRDLGPHLLPDVREPLALAQEDAMLGALAALHARFWESPALALEWLAQPWQIVGALGPECAASPQALAALIPQLRDAVPRGWAAAMRHLPPETAAFLCRPVADMRELWEGLPRTLVHGDCKVANFALLPDGRVAAFDFALLGAAPPAIEVGWYLAVNATRLARPREEFLARYRELLRVARGADVDDGTWQRFVRAAVLAGALMLLWSKALAFEGGAERAQAEWRWWTERLATIAS